MVLHSAGGDVDAPHISGMRLNLTDDEARAPAKHLRQALHGHTPQE
jgi:hypothetical protein